MGVGLGGRCVGEGWRGKVEKEEEEEEEEEEGRESK